MPALSVGMKVKSNYEPLTSTEGINVNAPKLGLSVVEAARAISICERKLRDLIAEGEIRHSRIGRRVVIPVSSLETFLEENLV